VIHHWKKSLLDGAAGIFERGGKAAVAAKIAEDTVRDPYAKIVRRAPERRRQRFFATKAQAVDREVMRHWNAIGPRDTAERNEQAKYPS